MKNIITLIATFLIACISFLFNYYLCSIATQIILGFTTSYFIFQLILVLDNLLDKYKIVEEVKEETIEDKPYYFLVDNGMYKYVIASDTKDIRNTKDITYSEISKREYIRLKKEYFK